jgi:hypothetical protein
MFALSIYLAHRKITAKTLITVIHPARPSSIPQRTPFKNRTDEAPPRQLDCSPVSIGALSAWSPRKPNADRVAPQPIIGKYSSTAGETHASRNERAATVNVDIVERWSVRLGMSLPA